MIAIRAPFVLRNLWFAAMAAALTAITSCAFTTTATEPYDLVLRGGTIVDGSGGDRYVGDVAVRGDRIAAVGPNLLARSATVIDVTGLVIAPGFINIHSHAEANALPSAVNMLSQGVTTEIINADGRSELDLNAQLGTLEDAGLAINVGGMIGFNSVWESVMAMEDRRPNADQIEAMRFRIRDGLEAGAFGVSAGLDYVPGYYARTDEVVDILKPFSAWQVVFANHDRITPESGYSGIAGMTETIEIGAATGLIPLITHMKMQGWEKGRSAEILARMAEAETGFPGGAVADMYPYRAGLTGLPLLIVPAWALEGGVKTVMERFADPTVRPKIIAEAEEQMRLRFGGPGGVYLLNRGQELTEIMAEMGVDSAGEAVLRLTEEEALQPVILRFGIQQDLDAIIAHPTTSVSCDCGASIDPRVHPRTWGTFPRVLGDYVRDRGVLTLEQAIHKMSALPAKTLGMRERGLLQVGLIADITVFDPATIRDHATYRQPTRMSEGIRHTLVNGQFAWRDGLRTEAQPGRALRRTPVD